MKGQAVAARRRAILEVVENQMRDNNPPETRQTFDLLIGQGIPSEEAMRLIGWEQTTQRHSLVPHPFPVRVEAVSTWRLFGISRTWTRNHCASG